MASLTSSSSFWAAIVLSFAASKADGNFLSLTSQSPTSHKFFRSFCSCGMIGSFSFWRKRRVSNFALRSLTSACSLPKRACNWLMPCCREEISSDNFCASPMTTCSSGSASGGCESPSHFHSHTAHLVLVGLSAGALGLYFGGATLSPSPAEVAFPIGRPSRWGDLLSNCQEALQLWQHDLEKLFPA